MRTLMSGAMRIDEKATGETEVDTFGHAIQKTLTSGFKAGREAHHPGGAARASSHSAVSPFSPRVPTCTAPIQRAPGTTR